MGRGLFHHVESQPLPWSDVGLCVAALLFHLVGAWWFFRWFVIKFVLVGLVGLYIKFPMDDALVLACCLEMLLLLGATCWAYRSVFPRRPEVFSE